MLQEAIKNVQNLRLHKLRDDTPSTEAVSVTLNYVASFEANFVDSDGFIGGIAKCVLDFRCWVSQIACQFVALLPLPPPIGLATILHCADVDPCMYLARLCVDAQTSAQPTHTLCQQIPSSAPLSICLSVYISVSACLDCLPACLFGCHIFPAGKPTCQIFIPGPCSADDHLQLA